MLCKLKRFFSPSCALLTILKILFDAEDEDGGAGDGGGSKALLFSATVRLVELLRSKHAAHLLLRTLSGNIVGRWYM